MKQDTAASKVILLAADVSVLYKLCAMTCFYSLNASCRLLCQWMGWFANNTECALWRGSTWGIPHEILAH